MRPLWKHQTEFIEKMRGKECGAAFFEMGTGKTRTLIEVLRERNRDHGRMLKTLILAPQIVCTNWRAEIARFAPEIPQSQVLVLQGTGLQRLKMLQSTPSYFIVIANYESLLMAPVFNFLKDWKPDVVIADESQKIKQHRAKRTKLSIAVSQLASYRYIMSGTPITKDQKDLFSQYLFLDGGKTFGKDYFKFLHLYFTDLNAKARKVNPNVKWHNWVPKEMRKDQLSEKAMSIAMAVKKSECLDLPPYIVTKTEVDMSPEQQKAYKQMKDDYITFVGSKAYTASVAVARALRLQQIASGYLMNEEGTVHFANTPKDQALIEHLETILSDETSKVVIWACWKANHDSIGKLLDDNGIPWRGLFGSTSAADRERNMRDFREDPNLRVLVASQGAASVGINLVEANYAIFYSRNFTLEHDMQAEARTYRGGSEIHSSVHRIDLVARGTIDETVTEALAKKKLIGESTIRELKV